ncbi:helix-turn-helix domain containing protein [Aerococcaceae bacterium NML190073]|nr:helix-turn-helix domain containing protein [Aerococcaceae bacterium NML190073]
MEIWILVVALLVIAILLFVLSVYAKDGETVDEKLSEFSVQQSQELLALKTRLAELEKEQRDTKVAVNNYDNVVEPEPVVENVSDLTREEVIRLYSQGYTMSEISAEMTLTIPTIQDIIDNYIENR